jgi:hypothetical protein
MRQLADAIGVSSMFGLSVIMLGCVPRLQSSEDLQAFVAVSGNYAIAERELVPTPAPDPDSDACESCNGTGKSDGTVTCPTCNGTGKRTKVQPRQAVSSVLVPSQSPICKTGTCSTRHIVR